MNDADNKQISISGQHNKFQLKRAQREKQRENKQNTFDEKLLLQTEQVRCINQIYLDNDFDNKNLYENEIKKKISGYKNQDVKKKRFYLQEISCDL